MKPSKQPKPAATKASATARKPASAGASRFTAILLNVGAALVAGVFLMVLFNHTELDAQHPEPAWNSGYDWLLNSMLKNNLETIDQHPDLTVQQRYEAKWGGEIGYFNQVKNQTPENAVVLLPTKAMLKEAGFKSVVDLPWATYFLYPRKVVYEDDKSTDPKYAQATHLVSINGWGLDKLNYQPQQPQAFMVLPIKK
ncbi:MAG: hypothetical protein U0T84_01580 [Chitinophagales bacterium]